MKFHIANEKNEWEDDRYASQECDMTFQIFICHGEFFKKVWVRTQWR